MRLAHALRLTLLCLTLSACVAPALLLPSTGQLMWALLKPLVGFDPNTVHLYEQPMVKARMAALLGPRYDTALQLLRTANQLQQEGPLFFVVSRYTPVPELASKAGLVWNAETNQMAAALLKGDGVEVFSEAVARNAESQADAAVAQVVPSWPSAMQTWMPP